MRASIRRFVPDPAQAKRLEHLVAAFAAFRRANRPGRRIPSGLRRQVVAALDAGVSTTAVFKACGVAWGQATRWRLQAHAGEVTAAAPQPQVLSVVDGGVPASSPPAEGFELRVGSWRISISRSAD